MAFDTKSFASLALAAVPDLDESNWIDQARRIDDALVNKHYLYRKILDGDLTKPVQKERETNMAFQTRFDKQDELQVQGRSTVNSKLGPTALLYQKDKNKDDLEGLLATLKERFRPKGSAVFDRLAGELLNLRLDDVKDVSEYNNLFVKLDGELALLHDSARLPTLQMARLYMNNLSSAFDTFKAHQVQSHDYVSANGKFTSLDELIEAVKKEEQRMYTESGTTTLFS